MKFTRALSLLIALCLLVTMFAGLTVNAADIITTPTGYTKASDVVYKTASNGTIANWGARGEDCVFLSKYAVSFYTGSYAYETLSKQAGGTTQSNAPSSALYKALQSMMSAKHSHQTSYNETRDLYCYTDCLLNNTAYISSFYSGVQLNGAWDSGKTWNREHTWPNSKGLGGNDENDIMMLRPTSISENSSRGNTAYGESSTYFDPGESVRGDCARIVLYVYTRWGNTGNMWGTGGVMENMDILLKWMEEDPVDTWEMGRNDSVQSITGTRNVFVDYPEYAWLLFGQELPENMTTPSGEALGNTPTTCSHESTHEERVEPTCDKAGKLNIVCNDCGAIVESSSIAKLGHEYEMTTIAPTCTDKGYDLYACIRCDDAYKKNYTDALDHTDEDNNGLCDRCGTEVEGGTTPPTPPEEDCPCEQFDDVSEGVWYHDSVVYAIRNNLMNGIAERRFDPSGSVTRAMLVTILYRSEGLPSVEGMENPFTDVKEDNWYTDAIIWAANNQIVNGMTATTFAPDAVITREQIATILYRYAKFQNRDVTLSGKDVLATFPDADKISAYAVDAVTWTIDCGIINGISGTISAGAMAIRAQIAAMLMRYLEN